MDLIAIKESGLLGVTCEVIGLGDNKQPTQPIRCTAAFDTGASFSCCGESILKRIPGVRRFQMTKPLRVRGVNGDCVEASEFAVLIISMASNIFDIAAVPIIQNLPVDLLIGNDQATMRSAAVKNEDPPSISFVPPDTTGRVVSAACYISPTHRSENVTALRLEQVDVGLTQKDAARTQGDAATKRVDAAPARVEVSRDERTAEQSDCAERTGKHTGAASTPEGKEQESRTASERNLLKIIVKVDRPLKRGLHIIQAKVSKKQLTRIPCEGAEYLLETGSLVSSDEEPSVQLQTSLYRLDRKTAS